VGRSKKMWTMGVTARFAPVKKRHGGGGAFMPGCIGAPRLSRQGYTFPKFCDVCFDLLQILDRFC
jgi:hypothetical protein